MSMQSPSRSGPFQHLIKLVFLAIVAKYIVIRVNLQHTMCALKSSGIFCPSLDISPRSLSVRHTFRLIQKQHPLDWQYDH